MRPRLTLLVVMALVQIGCMTEGPLFHKTLKSSKIEMATYDLTINDKRSSLAIRNLSIPALLGQGGQGFISPPLDSAVEDRSRQVIEQSLVVGSQDLVFTVDVLMGFQRLTEVPLVFTKEYVKWKLKVQVSEKSSQAPGLTAIGESWGRRTSRDATPDRFREMYLDSFAQALQDALAHLDRAKDGG